MRAPLLVLASALLLGSCDAPPAPPARLSAPPPPPAAFPSADIQPVPATPAEPAVDTEQPPAESATAAKPAPKKAATGSARTPRSFGIKECDRYARKACSCSDPHQRKRLCKDAHRSFGEWKKIAAHQGMQDFVRKSCKMSTTSIRNACP